MNVTLHGEGDAADVLTLRIMRWRDYPGLWGRSEWEERCNHRVLIQWKQEDQSQKEKDIRMEAEVREERSCYAAGCEDERRGHEPGKYRRCLKTEKR